MAGRSSAAGSHAIYHDPKSGRTTVVPDKIKSRHTANGTLMDAGIADRNPLPPYRHFFLSSAFMNFSYSSSLTP